MGIYLRQVNAIPAEVAILIDIATVALVVYFYKKIRS